MKTIFTTLVLAFVMFAGQDANAQLSDQQLAQQRVNKMAAYQLQGHLPGKPSYLFEGSGYRSNGLPPTCVPKRPMRLVADAIARDRNGWYYRIRFWRHY